MWGIEWNKKKSEERLPVHVLRRTLEKEKGESQDAGNEEKEEYGTRGWHLNGDVLYVEPRC